MTCSRPQRLISGPGRRGDPKSLDAILSARIPAPLLAEARNVAARSSRSFSDWVRLVINCAIVDAQQPTSEPRQAPPGPGTFTCPHLSISHVDSAQCGTCGPLQQAA